MSAGGRAGAGVRRRVALARARLDRSRLGERAVGVGRRVARLGDRVPAPWPFVLALFLGTKLLLTFVAVLVLRVFDDVPGAPPADERTMRLQQQEISPHRWISFWFAWDSFLYDHLSRLPLTEPWRDFGFPLLYPFLARPVALVLGGNTAMALLLISNVAFLFQLYYAHRLGGRLLGDDASARRFTRYLVLLPTAFLFQAALTESLFLCLALAAFYHAERRHWLAVGVIGYFLALSRSVGMFVVVPLALVLLRQQRYRLGLRALRGYVRVGWPLLLVPAGWLTFMAFCWWQSGDWFAYKHAQEKGWAITVQNPLAVLIEGLTSAEPRDSIRVWFAVAVLVVVVAGVRHIGLPYLVYALVTIMVPLSMGPPVYKSLLRYLLAVFPVCLVLARWARQATLDTYLTAALALVQGALFVAWLAYWTHFVI
ncbi:hypothetical protein [Micromonospora inyonensis]|uniref:Mannosyltransferase (PIG-V) n=1 Tax=Micromonospora inyonensis TaxID=47866 RepID=A0A1C6S8G9_9ACTN|nr:hypothetical protein [Micromonospora inyonensis]SCL25794.1 hypothetical protein GA0074694_4327 [Micromonospora inyonensis]